MKINLTDTQKAIAVVAARVIVPVAAVIVANVVVEKIINKTPAE